MVKRRREVSTDDEKNPSGEEMASPPVVAPVRSVDLDATRSQTDPKHYRLITLSNGLQAMLISDPRAPSGTHKQPPFVCVYIVFFPYICHNCLDQSALNIMPSF